MAFGQKTGSLKNLKKSLAKGGGGGAFIKYIPKNGNLNVRFIQEPEEWVNYVEHYDQMARKSFPCNGESSCPGCKGQDRASSRYLANAVDLDNNNRVIPLQLPKDLANRLVVKYEKWGTLTDRDIELSRSGEGLDTVYDLEPDAPSKRNLGQFQPHDLEKVLEDAFNSVFGAGADDDEDDAPAPTVRKRTQSKAAKKATAPEPQFDVDEDDDEDEEEPEADEEKAEDEPEEDDADEADEDDDEPEEDDGEEGHTEEELRAMPLGVLRKVARDDYGVATKGKSKDELIDAIFEAGDDA